MISRFEVRFDVRDSVTYTLNYPCNPAELLYVLDVDFLCHQCEAQHKFAGLFLTCKFSLAIKYLVYSFVLEVILYT